MATDFTIADVLAWARTKPADGRYDYSAPTSCALCRFLCDTGRTEKAIVCPQSDEADTAGWRPFGVSDFKWRPYPVELEPALKDGRTFGGLAQMLEAICPDTPINESNWTAIDAYLSEIETVAA